MTGVAPARILVVDDDRTFRLSTAALLRGDGHEVAVAEDGRAAVAWMREHRADLLLVDLRMPGIDGLQLVESLRVWGHGVPILMISGAGSIEVAVRALHLGADDFLTKPVEPALLSARVADLLDRRPTPGSETSFGMVGRSPAMHEVLDRIRRVAPTETNVLVTGETGVGKELAARAVHVASARAGGPFLAVNCGALSEGLLESELFGHVRGAFTGALRDRSGLFEAARGGTLFLDEVGEMSVALQQRLLRVLQEREVTRVGTTTPVPVDVRVVAATNRDLAAMAREGRFREDLYYRLAIFPIHIPPLRERAADIPLLVEHGVARLRRGHPAWAQLSVSPFAMRALRAYSWPGNVRELLGALESAALFADAGRVEAQHLPASVRESVTGEERRYRAAQSANEERASIEAALEHAGGVASRAAELLGMGRTTLWRKLRSYGIRSAPPPEQEGDASGGDEPAPADPGR